MYQGLLELLELVFFAAEFALGDLQVHFDHVLLAAYVLVHLVDLVKVLLKALGLLLEL